YNAPGGERKGPPRPLSLALTALPHLVILHGGGLGGCCRAAGTRAATVYDANDPVEDQRQTSNVAAVLRAGGIDELHAYSPPLLAALPATNGQPVRLDAQRDGSSFDQLRQICDGTAAQRIVGTHLTALEAFARLAALGRDPSPQPVAFHCIENGCHGRAQL